MPLFALTTLILALVSQGTYKSWSQIYRIDIFGKLIIEGKNIIWTKSKDHNGKSRQWHEQPVIVTGKSNLKSILVFVKHFIDVLLLY